MNTHLMLGGALLVVGFVAGSGAARWKSTPGVVVQYDSVVARREPGPHAGGGETTAYPFFASVPGLALVFRKRALHRGAAIGYHRNDTDEIYYVLSGQGELTADGMKRDVGAGTAILTRAGSSHGLRQLGANDLVIVIDYQRADTRSSSQSDRSVFTDSARFQQICTEADSGLTPAVGRCTPRDQRVRIP
jgi:quercetin dioxygenase-like cupin family protein